MSDHLRLPSDLQRLIEKRAEADRRKRARRVASRRQVDLGPLGTLESAVQLDEAVLEERRMKKERRKLADRRRRKRRAEQGRDRKP